MSHERSTIDVEESEIELDPSWRHALQQLLAEGLTFGSTVTRERIGQMCRLEKGTDYTSMRKYDLKLLGIVHHMREELLHEHRMLLVTDNNQGYEIVHPHEQTSYAIEQGVKGLKKAYSQMAERIAYVRVDLLTDQQRRENMDAQAKVGALGAMLAPARVRLLETLKNEPIDAEAKQ